MTDSIGGILSYCRRKDPGEELKDNLGPQNDDDNKMIYCSIRVELILKNEHHRVGYILF